MHAIMNHCHFPLAVVELRQLAQVGGPWEEEGYLVAKTCKASDHLSQGIRLHHVQVESGVESIVGTFSCQEWLQVDSTSYPPMAGCQR